MIPRFFGGFPTQQIQRDPPNPAEIFGGVALTRPATVFVNVHVQNVVQLVLDAPVAANDLTHPSGITVLDAAYMKVELGH